jgi:hypothetical protein
LRRQISIFVYEHGFFNAGLVRLFRRRAIFLNSEVLETGVSDNEVRWIVGRFVGYLRVQQDTGIIGLMVHIAERSGIFTLLIFPYSRAMVYTGDRLGLAAIAGDIGSAVSAMQKLLVGRKRPRGRCLPFWPASAAPFPRRWRAMSISSTLRGGNFPSPIAFSKRRRPACRPSSTISAASARRVGRSPRASVSTSRSAWRFSSPCWPGWG